MYRITKFNKILGENIRNFRIEKGWDQKELAKRVGYSSKESISRIENGNMSVSGEILINFSKIFGVTAEDLIAKRKSEEKTIFEYSQKILVKNRNDSTENPIKKLINLAMLQTRVGREMKEILEEMGARALRTTYAK